MGKTIFLSVGAVLTILLVVFLFNGFASNDIEGNYNAAIKVGTQEVVAEIVDSDEERNRGLGGRNGLPEDSGMLFIFETPAEYSFWMKNMRFSIDIIWIDENKKVTAISENISPETYPASFSPSDPVKYVLEVNAGWAEKNGVKAGDSIEW